MVSSSITSPSKAAYAARQQELKTAECRQQGEKHKRHATLEKVHALFGKIITNFIPEDFFAMMAVNRLSRNALRPFLSKVAQDKKRRDQCLTLASQWMWGYHRQDDTVIRELVDYGYPQTADTFINEIEDRFSNLPSSTENLHDGLSSLALNLKNLVRCARIAKQQGRKETAETLYAKAYGYVVKYLDDATPLSEILVDLVENAEISLESMNPIIDKELRKKEAHLYSIPRCIKALVAFAKKQPNTERPRAIAALTRAFEIAENYQWDINEFAQLLNLGYELGMETRLERIFRFFDRAIDVAFLRSDALYKYARVLLEFVEKGPKTTQHEADQALEKVREIVNDLEMPFRSHGILHGMHCLLDVINAKTLKQQEEVKKIVNKMNVFIDRELEHMERKPQENGALIPIHLLNIHSKTLEFCWIPYRQHLQKYQEARTNRIYKELFQHVSCQYSDGRQDVEDTLIRLGEMKIKHFFSRNVTAGQSCAWFANRILQEVCNVGTIQGTHAKTPDRLINRRIIDRLFLNAFLRFAEENGRSNQAETGNALDKACEIAKSEYRRALELHNGSKASKLIAILCTIAKGKAKNGQIQEAHEMLDQIVDEATTTHRKKTFHEINALEKLSSINLSCYLLP